jgi:hypothetical protein
MILLQADPVSHRVPGGFALPSGVQGFRPGPPALVPERILRIQGYSDPERVRAAIRDAAAQMTAVAASLCQAQVAYRSVEITAMDDQGVCVHNGVRLSSQAFAHRLEGCHHLVAFVLSCGEVLSQKVIDLADAGDLLEAVLLESAGWLCIEDATRQFKHWLREQLEVQGCRITSRMGPGYTYQVDGQEVTWPLEDHPNLFTLFEGAHLPVQLMASCAMKPKLSRSGLYGVGPLHQTQVGRPDRSH